MAKKKYQYSVSSNQVWTSFDFGEVEAESLEEATKLSIEKLDYDFKKANEILTSSENTAGFTLNFSQSAVEVTEITNK